MKKGFNSEIIFTGFMGKAQITPKNPGFTLLEVLAAMAIISIGMLIYFKFKDWV